ncbi:hypothetical protein [Janthinobacterium sp. HLX7-2]|uniref:hypothetical protein n=1 Tax=Janthinobacterium sp. HLX7-2 TaxID=1259331 RepID=UPI003F29D587
MIRFFTTWLILILVTAIPLHAGAVRMGLACAPAPQQAAHGLAAEPCHHHTASLATAGAPSEQLAGQAGDDGATSQHATCHACSAFCMAALMPPACFCVPAFTASENVTIATATLAAGFIPDGPRRPPRHIRAQLA